MVLSLERVLQLTREPQPLLALLDELRCSDYSTSAVARAIGMRRPAHTLITHTAYCALAYYDAALANGSQTAVLGMLLACGGMLESAIYERRVSRRLRDLLDACAVICDDGCRVHSSVCLHDCNGHWLLSDPLLRRSPEELHLSQDFAEHVDPPNYSSLCLLWNTTACGQTGTFLDVGCGTGLQCLQAASRYDRSIGIDINARAVAFSRLNARANGTAVCVEQGDCLSYSAPTRLDRIVFNSPSVPRYEANLHKIDTYTSQFGYELALQSMEQRLPSLLADTGMAELWSIFAVPSHFGTAEAVVRDTVRTLPDFDVEMIIEANSPFGLSHAEIVAHTVPRDSFLLATPEDGKRLLRFVKDRGIERICPVLMRIRPKSARRGVLIAREVETLLRQ